MPQLSLSTVPEIVAELVDRPEFLGLIVEIHQATPTNERDRFTINHTGELDRRRAVHVLQEAAERMERL